MMFEKEVVVMEVKVESGCEMRGTNETGGCVICVMSFVLKMRYSLRNWRADKIKKINALPSKMIF
jgi:hypothetical protein